MIYIILKLLGSLALLMYGMKTMSESLQKMAGPQLRRILGTMTTNRVTGLFTGAFVTAAVQSSTATTVMTVSFVNAGLLTLKQAISVIMGANIGTTLTAWIMSAGFNFNMGNIVFPFFILGIILIYAQKSSRKSGGEFIFGLCFLFLGLATLRENAADMDLGNNQEVIDFFARTGSWGFGSTLLFLLLGSLMTMCVQSSAAVIAITMILCSSGALPIYQGIALVMGENIGTTVTSNVVAMTGNTQARRAAMAHMVFNVFGVIWVLCVFKPFINMVCGMVNYDPASPTADPRQLSVVLAAFHTSFNVCNVLILIWFVPLIEKLVSIIIPKKESDDEFHLQFISGGILSTSELSILQAKKEIFAFVNRTKKMFDHVKLLYDEKNESEAVKLYSKIEKYESICDRLEIEIANYLNKVAEGRLSDSGKQEIHKLLREISEIESIGDSCFNLSRTLLRKSEKKVVFTSETDANVHIMMDLVQKSIDQLDVILHCQENITSEIDKSNNIEHEINNFRSALKEQNIISLNEKQYTYEVGVMYMDFISECEKMGDYIINVVEAHCETTKLA
ncbi:MAG: Na/Pi cotransporter family protein [Paludibacteraceae bacterium]|nr:Na/Pi cotransporter family protein [Paludibacteraceae bacterium]